VLVFTLPVIPVVLSRPVVILEWMPRQAVAPHRAIAHDPHFVDNN
jgi:hypothetical protein